MSYDLSQQQAVVGPLPRVVRVGQHITPRQAFLGQRSLQRNAAETGLRARRRGEILGTAAKDLGELGRGGSPAELLLQGGLGGAHRDAQLLIRPRWPHQPPVVAEVAAQLTASRQFAFDTETTGTDPYSADLVGVSVAWGPSLGQAAYIPLRHFDTPGLPWETVAAALQPAFANPEIDKIAHNISYDLGILNRAGLKVESPIVDTMVAAWLIDPGMRGLGLKDLAWTRLRTEMTRITDLLGTGKTQITFDQAPLDKATRYAAEDADVTLRLWERLKPRISREKVATIYETQDRPLIPVVADMERAGVLIDRDKLSKLSGEFAQPGMSIMAHSWKSLPSLPENCSWSCTMPPPTIANLSLIHISEPTRPY